MKKREFLWGTGAAAIGLAAPSVWTGIAHAQANYEGRMIQTVSRHVNAAGMMELIDNTERLAGSTQPVQADGATSSVSVSDILDYDRAMSGGFPGGSLNSLYAGSTLLRNTCLFNTRYTSSYENFCLSYMNSNGTQVFLEGPALVAISAICEAIRQEFSGRVSQPLPSIRSACLPNTVQENDIRTFAQLESGITEFRSETAVTRIEYRTSTAVSNQMEAVYVVSNIDSGTRILDGRELVQMNV